MGKIKKKPILLFVIAIVALYAIIYIIPSVTGALIMNLETTTYYNNKRNGKGNQESSRFGNTYIKYPNITTLRINNTVNMILRFFKFFQTNPRT